MAKPPIIKQQVATKEGHCKLDNPIMVCPDVHPLAYRVPKPTKKPPKTKNIKPFIVKRLSKLNIEEGIKLWSTSIFKA